MNASDTTALIIEHTVKKGHEQRYEQWLREILAEVSAFTGYLGREIFPPPATGKPYTSIVRFHTDQDLQVWLDSSERRRFIEQIQDALEGGDRTQIKAGIDVWFTPSDALNKPKAYKQFLLSAAAIYPLSQIVPRLMLPFYKTVPLFENPLVSGLITTLITTGLMTYAVMPYLTYWMRGWLYSTTAEGRK